jgi:hypothetical protein
MKNITKFKIKIGYTIPHDQKQMYKPDLQLYNYLVTIQHVEL